MGGRQLFRRFGWLTPYDPWRGRARAVICLKGGLGSAAQGGVGRLASLADHVAGLDVGHRKQRRCAVSPLVVGAGFGLHREQRRVAVEGLNAGPAFALAGPVDVLRADDDPDARQRDMFGTFLAQDTSHGGHNG